MKTHQRRSWFVGTALTAFSALLFLAGASFASVVFIGNTPGAAPTIDTYDY